jgi:hypothetical protein
MAGSRALRKLQLGQETTAGTPVAATTIWRGKGVIKDNREVVFPEENVGILGGTSRSHIARTWSELNMPDVVATYNQIGYLCAAGIEDITTGAADGAGTDKIYQYDASTTSQNSIQTFTIEGGDDQQAEEFDYAFVKRIRLSGQGQNAVMMSADWIGREATNTTFTGALTIPSVEDIITNSGKLYIDAIGGTIGSTQISSTLLEFNLDWVTGLMEYWALDGSNEFSLHKFTEDEIILRLIYEHNASAVAEKAIYRAGTPQLFQVLFEGSAFGTPGTTYSNHSLVLNFAGVYEDWGALDERNGNDVVEATVRARYDTTATFKAQIIAVNEDASLT